MKKEIITLALSMAVLFAGIGIASADETTAPFKAPVKKEQMKMKKMSPEEIKAAHEKRIAGFNKALGLTEAQTEQAKKLRLKGHDEMRPVMEKKRAKFEEMKKIIDNDNLSVKTQEKKVEALKKDIHELDLRAKQIRRDNEKAFEAILTPEQKAKYLEIKAEGRKHYMEHKKPQGPENFGHRPPYGHKMPHQIEK